MVSNSAKLDRRTKQHTQFGVSVSDGSRDMVRTRSWRKKKEKRKKKNELVLNHIASPTEIANNNNKVDVQFPHNLVRKLHTQACEIVARTKWNQCKKFQVDICKTTKDRSAHVQLRTL